MRPLGWRLLLLLAALSWAWGNDFSITAVVRKSGLSWEEAAAALLLARALDLDATFIISTRKEAEKPVFALAPAFVIAKVGKKDIRQILKEHSKGHGWGVLAHRLGVHPGAFNQSRIALSKLKDDDLIACVWLMVLSQTFRIPQERVVELRKQGLTWGDIVTALQIASGANAPFERVLTHWRKEKDWAKVREQFGVSPDWLPSTSEQQSSSDKSAKRFPPSKGHGRGHGKR